MGAQKNKKSPDVSRKSRIKKTVSSASSQERKRLILGNEEYERQMVEEMVSKGDSQASMATRKLILWSAVLGMMTIVLIGWSTMIRSAFNTVSAGEEENALDWSVFKNDITQLVSETKQSFGEILPMAEELANESAIADDDANVNDSFVKSVEDEITKKNTIDTSNWIEFKNESIAFLYPHDWFFFEDDLTVQTSSLPIALDDPASEGDESQPDQPQEGEIRSEDDNENGEVAGALVSVAKIARNQGETLQSWFLANRDEYPEMTTEFVELGGAPALLGYSAAQNGCQQFSFAELPDEIFTFAFCATNQEMAQKYQNYFQSMMMSVSFNR